MKILLLIIFFGTIARAGTESGGGGSVVIRGDHPLLIDYLNIDPQFTDSKTYKNYQALAISNSARIEFDTHTNQNLPSAHPAFDLAFSTIEKWAALNYDIVGYWTQSSFLKPVSWTFTYNKLTAATYTSPHLLITEPIETAAYYKASYRDYSIQIFIPLWNQMGILSQAGLLIHEALRHVQIGHLQRFDERNLQHATAIFMMCEPTDRLGYYIRYLVMNGSAIAEKLYGTFDELIRNDCRRNF